jgi:hypothetical protein
MTSSLTETEVQMSVLKLLGAKDHLNLEFHYTVFLGGFIFFYKNDCLHISIIDNAESER